MPYEMAHALCCPPPPAWCPSSSCCLGDCIITHIIAEVPGRQQTVAVESDIGYYPSLKGREAIRQHTIVEALLRVGDKAVMDGSVLVHSAGDCFHTMTLPPQQYGDTVK